MDALDAWLGGSTWRRVHVWQYGGQYFAEAHTYPNLDNQSAVIATGKGETVEEALTALDTTLQAMAAQEPV